MDRVGIKGGRCAASNAARSARGGLRPGAATLYFSVIICDGNQTINNYSVRNTVTTRGRRAEGAKPPRSSSGASHWRGGRRHAPAQ